jgi:hypothetical protein
MMCAGKANCELLPFFAAGARRRADPHLCLEVRGASPDAASVQYGNRAKIAAFDRHRDESRIRRCAARERPHYRHTNLSLCELLKELKTARIWIVGADESNYSKDLLPPR